MIRLYVSFLCGGFFVDIATILGVVGAIGLLIMAMMLSGDIGMFIDTQSMIIVFGGSIFVVLSNYNLGQFFGIGKIVQN